jgi:5-methylcytosine-specific restriction endonuclease McrA
MKLKPFDLFKDTPKDRTKGFYQSPYWKHIRKEHLNMNPICTLCEQQGNTVTATEVDHIIQRRAGGSDYPDNLQSLCRYHHRLKTSSEGQRAMYDNNPKWIKE